MQSRRKRHGTPRLAKMGFDKLETLMEAFRGSTSPSDDEALSRRIQLIAAARNHVRPMPPRVGGELQLA